jgi:hypothetical protein
MTASDVSEMLELAMTASGCNPCLRPTVFSAGRELSAYSVVFPGYLSCIQYSLMARTASGM